MVWVDEWENGVLTSFTFDDTTIGTICRTNDYYVNPNSEKNIELGTKQYPFRDINLVFIELMNEFSNTNTLINIYVMKDSYNYIGLEMIRLKNITSVNIESYSDDTTDSDKRAIFIITDAKLNFESEKTMFNLIQSLEIKEINSSGMEATEYEEFNSTTGYVFLLNKWDFSINNIDVYSKISDNLIIAKFVYTVYQFKKIFRLTNMHLQIKGFIYHNNIATANLFAENLTLDMYESYAGFFYDGYCNFEGDLNLADHEL